MQQQQQLLQQKQQLYTQLKDKLGALNSAAASINNSLNFQAISASSTDTAVATLSNQSATNVGTYNLTVSQLAQAHKINSGAQSSATTAMNMQGNFVVNGKFIDVTANDTLTMISQKINSANVGVTASIIDGGAGKAYLTLTSSKTGASGAIQLADQTGGILSSLNLLSGSTTARSPITNGLESASFSSSTSTFASMMNTSGVGSRTVQVNGTNITMDDTDSLTSLAGKINASGAATATVVSSTDSANNTNYKLQITNSPGGVTLTDSQNTFTALGFLQQGYSNQLLAAQDANYTLDGLSLTSSTNTITGAIPGATLTLLKGTSTSPGTTTLNLTRDLDGIKSRIQGFADAYNGVVDFIKTYSAFDSKTYESGPLFGDSTAQQVISDISSRLFNSVPGGTGNYNNLANIGFGLDTDNKLTVDSSALTAALSNNLSQVANLFKATGISSNSNLNYISSTNKSKSSGAVSYAVNITQAATQTSTTAALAQSSNLTASETLTFVGGVFGSSPYSLILPSGLSQSGIVAAINGDAKLKTLIKAGTSSGKLVLSALQYGSVPSFTVTSDKVAATNNSGIGTAGQGVVTNGVDVSGTINGEAATGTGQFLTGATGNSTTEGLQIQYTGSTTGAIGSMQFNKGVAGTITDSISNFNDSINGIFATVNKSLQTQIDDITGNITSLQTKLTAKTQDLRVTFAKMEQAIASYQQQGSQLASITGSSAKR